MNDAQQHTNERRRIVRALSHIAGGACDAQYNDARRVHEVTVGVSCDVAIDAIARALNVAPNDDDDDAYTRFDTCTTRVIVYHIDADDTTTIDIERAYTTGGMS